MTLSMESGEDFQAFDWKVVTPAGEQEIFQVVAGQLGPPLGGKIVILRRKNDRIEWAENKPDDYASHHCDAA